MRICFSPPVNICERVNGKKTNLPHLKQSTPVKALIGNIV